MCTPAYIHFDSHPVWNPPADLLDLGRHKGIGLLGELLQEFCKDTESRIYAISQELAGGDLSRVRSQAHALKGSALQMRADRLASLCARMEQAADVGDRAETVAMLEAVQTEFYGVGDRMSQVANLAAADSEAA